jgi:hypothetical protein
MYIAPMVLSKILGFMLIILYDECFVEETLGGSRYTLVCDDKPRYRQTMAVLKIVQLWMTRDLPAFSPFDNSEAVLGGRMSVKNTR